MTEGIETTFETQLTLSRVANITVRCFCIVNSAGEVSVYNDLMGQRSNLRPQKWATMSMQWLLFGVNPYQPTLDFAFII